MEKRAIGIFLVLLPEKILQEELDKRMMTNPTATLSHNHRNRECKDDLVEALLTSVLEKGNRAHETIFY